MLVIWACHGLLRDFLNTKRSDLEVSFVGRQGIAVNALLLQFRTQHTYPVVLYTVRIVLKFLKLLDNLAERRFEK